MQDNVADVGVIATSLEERPLHAKQTHAHARMFMQGKVLQHEIVH